MSLGQYLEPAREGLAATVENDISNHQAVPEVPHDACPQDTTQADMEAELIIEDVPETRELKIPKRFADVPQHRDDVPKFMKPLVLSLQADNPAAPPAAVFLGVGGSAEKKYAAYLENIMLQCRGPVAKLAAIPDKETEVDELMEEKLLPGMAVAFSQPESTTTERQFVAAFCMLATALYDHDIVELRYRPMKQLHLTPKKTEFVSRAAIAFATKYQDLFLAMAPYYGIRSKREEQAARNRYLCNAQVRSTAVEEAKADAAAMFATEETTSS